MKREKSMNIMISMIDSMIIWNRIYIYNNIQYRINDYEYEFDVSSGRICNSASHEHY
jgi:hypothetical protein